MNKFTICYRDVRSFDERPGSDVLFCEHGEGSSEAVVANELIEKRIMDEVTDKQLDRAMVDMVEWRSYFQVLYAFRGHQKQLL